MSFIHNTDAGPWPPSPFPFLPVRYLDALYFNDNSSQSLIRIYITLSLAKTQGSLSSANTQGSIHVRINQRILLN